MSANKITIELVERLIVTLNRLLPDRTWCLIIGHDDGVHVQHIVSGDNHVISAQLVQHAGEVFASEDLTDTPIEPPKWGN
jgi:hypothetical protein